MIILTRIIPDIADEVFVIDIQNYLFEKNKMVAANRWKRFAADRRSVRRWCLPVRLPPAGNLVVDEGPPNVYLPLRVPVDFLVGAHETHGRPAERRSVHRTRRLAVDFRVMARLADYTVVNLPNGDFRPPIDGFRLVARDFRAIFLPCRGGIAPNEADRCRHESGEDDVAHVAQLLVCCR